MQVRRLRHSESGCRTAHRCRASAGARPSAPGANGAGQSLRECSARSESSALPPSGGRGAGSSAYFGEATTSETGPQGTAECRRFEKARSGGGGGAGGQLSLPFAFLEAFVASMATRA